MQTLDKNIQIEIGEYLLRPLSVKDVSDKYLSWFSDQDAHKFIEYSKTDVTKESLVKYVQEKSESDTALFLGIFFKGSHIGNIKFEPINLKEQKATVGIFVGDKEFRSKGVGSLVLSKSCHYLGKKWGIKYIDLGVDSTNLKAIRAYENCGFKVQGITEKEHASIILMQLVLD